MAGGEVSEPAGREPRLGLRSLVPYLREHRRSLVIVAVLSVVGAAAALAQPLLTRALLTAVETGTSLTPSVSALVAVMLLASALSGVQRYLLNRTAEGVVLDTRIVLAGHLLRLPIAEHDRRRAGDLMSRVGADTTLLREVVTSGLVEAASGVIVVIGAAVAMAFIDPFLLLVTLLSIGIGVGLTVRVAQRIRALSREAQERVGEMTAAVERALGAVRTIRANRAEERETQAVGGSARGAYDAGIRAAKLEAIVAPASGLAVQGSFLVVLAVGGARVATGTIAVADLIAFILFLFLLVLPLAQTLRAYTTLQTGLGALARIEEIRALPTEAAHDRVTAPAADRGAPLLEVVDVDFAYPDGTAVLHGVSFAVPRGTRTALVGPSGAGKSTLLALVERFYDPTGGALRVEGVDIRDLPRDALRRRIGYVEQEAPALAGSLRENLLLGAPDADDARLHAVLATVNLTALVARAPDGLDSEVGDAGVLLSGGERQRLAIARVLLSAPPLLLLDEPTSNLDARNEQALRDAVDAVAVDRTLLVVAHRLSTVVDADQIVVLDEGRVVGVGRHDELVASSPLYRELAATQLLVPDAR